jgi:hypothetical protein
VAGTYTSAQSVTISTTTPGASIRYTTDGSTPSPTVGTVYSGPVAVASTETIKAIAYETGWTSSSVTSSAYTITGTVANPSYSPVSGTYTSAQSVTISTTTPGASIRYTTDGSTPTETTGTLYSGPVTVSTTTTINAIAYISGLADSGVATAVFTIVPPPNVTSITPTSGAGGVQVTIFGTGFGAAQGTGTVWLGSTLGGIVSWSDTQIIATVASSSTAGTAGVQQYGTWSNSVPFGVSTVTISGVTPASGLPGT